MNNVINESETTDSTFNLLHSLGSGSDGYGSHFEFIERVDNVRTMYANNPPNPVPVDDIADNYY